MKPSSEDERSSSAERRVATRAALADPDVRARARVQLRHDYEQGASIRELARLRDHSYGTVHNLLLEGGTALRAVGRQTGGA